MGYLSRSKCHHYERWGWEWEGESPSTSLAYYYFDMFAVFYSRTFTVSPTPNITVSVLSLQVILTALRFPIFQHGNPPYFLLSGNSHCGRASLTHQPHQRRTITEDCFPSDILHLKPLHFIWGEAEEYCLVKSFALNLKIYLAEGLGSQTRRINALSFPEAGTSNHIGPNENVSKNEIECES